MKIILRQDYENLGKTGDIVNVKPGYARNYLLPKKIAYPAAPNYVRMLEEEKRQKQQRQRKEKKQAEELAAQLSSVSLTISASVGEEDKMFGTVTTQDIAEALKEHKEQIYSSEDKSFQSMNGEHQTISQELQVLLVL